jgi:hypothetical protein
MPGKALIVSGRTASLRALPTAYICDGNCDPPVHIPHLWKSGLLNNADRLLTCDVERISIMQDPIVEFLETALGCVNKTLFCFPLGKAGLQ